MGTQISDHVPAHLLPAGIRHHVGLGDLPFAGGAPILLCHRAGSNFCRRSIAAGACARAGIHESGERLASTQRLRRHMLVVADHRVTAVGLSEWQTCEWSTGAEPLRQR